MNKFLKYTTAVGLSAILAVTGLTVTHNTIREQNNTTTAYASIIPVSQRASFVEDTKYEALDGDQYQAYLKAEAERKAKEKAEAERKAKEAKEKAEREAREKAEAEAAAKQAAENAKQQKYSSSTRSANSGSGKAPVAGKASPGSAKAYAAQQVAARGWGSNQYDCLVSLWNKESGWNMNAHNSSSGAFGIPQALPGSKMSSAGADWRTNHETQINWGLGYISGRYGTPCGAWSHSQSVGWY